MIQLKFTCEETLHNRKPGGAQRAANFVLSEVGTIADRRSPELVVWEKVNREDPKAIYAGQLQIAIADDNAMKDLLPGQSVIIALP